jgi:hypothetical protein
MKLLILYYKVARAANLGKLVVISEDLAKPRVKARRLDKAGLKKDDIVCID